MAVPLIGYLDRFSARPGERVAVQVSSALAEPYRADLVRIVCADPNPAGPGMKLIAVPSAFAGSYPSRRQAVALGSYGIVDAAGRLDLSGAWTLAVRVQPGLADARERAVLALSDAAGARLVLSVTPTGAALATHTGSERQHCSTGAPMLPRHWYELRAICDGTSVVLRQTKLRRTWGATDAVATAASPIDLAVHTIMFAAAPDGASVGDLFDGRTEDPLLLRGAHAGPALLDPPAFAATEALLAWWDFAIGIEGETITDRGPLGLHGRLVNLPTRGVRGSRWTGAETCWRHMPRDYAAIHFHADDLSDCGWQTDFSFDIAADLPSGVYGVRLRGGLEQDLIPFYVLPPRGTATAPVAFLASTFTYQAYANHARDNCDDAYRARRAAWGAYPHSPDEHHDYSHSTYNRHPDNSGICYSTLRRPILTMRPGFLTFDDKRGSGLRHFPADSHLTDWLESNGFAFDVITDHDLDREGIELLRAYRAVLTGSHPEYHTPRTLDALQTYVDGGGRLAYLGGNGFYWRIANSEAVPDVIEVRRAEGGIRAWAAEPGEYFHALDGGYGGLWRRNGRPPQALAGVGFSGQGLFEGSYYRRLPASYDPRAAWIFDGIDDEILGDHGLSGGGAAGFELDRADVTLGSPPNTLVLARSENHQAHFVAVPEEILSHVNTLSGEDEQALIRAEIIYFETTAGGAVFATGSITFCGSLWRDGYDHPVSRMLHNVVTRFAAP